MLDCYKMVEGGCPMFLNCCSFSRLVQKALVLAFAGSRSMLSVQEMLLFKESKKIVVVKSTKANVNYFGRRGVWRGQRCGWILL
jgi:hypothetical protein